MVKVTDSNRSNRPIAMVHVHANNDKGNHTLGNMLRGTLNSSKIRGGGGGGGGKEICMDPIVQ